MTPEELDEQERGSTDIANCKSMTLLNRLLANETLRMIAEIRRLQAELAECRGGKTCGETANCDTLPAETGPTKPKE
jgi:hypothetical protein